MITCHIKKKLTCSKSKAKMPKLNHQNEKAKSKPPTYSTHEK